MIQVVIASTNPVKINATKEGFKQVITGQEIKTLSANVDSGVANQPMSDQETLQGAINRANRACEERPDADYWIGLEGGIETIRDQYHSFAWVAIKSKTGLEYSRTATFSIPHNVKQIIDGGTELGFAIDQVYGLTNAKHSNGAVGIFTQNRITRTTLYIPAVVIALSRLQDHNSPFT